MHKFLFSVRVPIVVRNYNGSPQKWIKTKVFELVRQINGSGTISKLFSFIFQKVVWSIARWHSFLEPFLAMGFFVVFLIRPVLVSTKFPFRTVLTIHTSLVINILSRLNYHDWNHKLFSVGLTRTSPSSIYVLDKEFLI